MPTQDRTVTIHPYFQVPEGKMHDFRELCQELVSKAATEPECLYYGFSFHDNQVYCREGYEGAEGLLAHLSNVGSLLQDALKIAEITRLEVHGIDEELAKLFDPLSDLKPTYFTLQYGIRR
jgi:hypothetical protein